MLFLLFIAYLESEKWEQKLVKVLEQKTENNNLLAKLQEEFKIACPYELQNPSHELFPSCPVFDIDNPVNTIYRPKMYQCVFDDEIYDLEIAKLKNKIAEERINELPDL
ncbi:hypothetical protein M9Y10_013763 [Tritrichomonas musculus]|uniref:Uncharacterized protein n=1 Tax=Tritrichomonas musculus TaxID=1915356 RepID=A0ABR2KZN3_9EUKA